MRQPYGAHIASTVVYAHPSWYAQQGYLVLVLDVRGRGNSGGEFSGFATEAPDGDDALAWLKATRSAMARWAATASATKGSPNCWAATTTCYPMP